MKYRAFTSMQGISMLHVKSKIREFVKKNKPFANTLKFYLSTVLLFFGVLTINAQISYWEGGKAKKLFLL